MKMPNHSQPDEKWCDLLGSYSADELVAGGVVAPDKWDFAKRIIEQQAYILLVSNAYPAGDLNSN
jgi:hypothetical protein